MQIARATRSHPAGEAVLAAVIFVGATVAVAGVGSLATSAGMDWYDGLDKPGFTPPDATFGVVWTILYAAIALAGWLAWRASDDPRPTRWWAVQMALNLAWTVVFFGLRSPVGGTIVIVVLLAAIVATVTAAARVSTPAAVLLFPYLVWCGFAAALTVGVTVLN